MESGDVNLDHQDMLLDQGAFDEDKYRSELNQWLDDYQEDKNGDEFQQ
jgi:hypothetical protein